MKGLVNVTPDTFFHTSSRQSRGHRYKLGKPRARLEIRKHCFSHRVVDACNCLPAHAVESVTVNRFKAAIQRPPHGAFKSWRQLPAPQGHLANTQANTYFHHDNTSTFTVIKYTFEFTCAYQRNTRPNYAVQTVERVQI